jgi:predicted lipoprotein with Yx(FWY)xxD motif
MRHAKSAASLGAVALAALAFGASVPGAAAVARSTPATARASVSPSAASTELRTRKIGKVTVVTNAKGFTVYSFAPDTSTASKCNGTCAHYWPPVKGPAKGGPGVTGKLGTIKRSDGSTQATYNGHPLYTYIGDTKPGQAGGNGLNLSGGVWHEVPASGKPVPASSSSHASSGGGSGY